LALVADRGAEYADQVGVGHGQAVAVADPAGQLGGLRSET
jgi:hypothetical protein